MEFAPDTYAIIGTILAAGFALAGMGWRMASPLDKRIGEDRPAAEAGRRAAQANADANRRQWQASMDAFRQEMLRLAERQSRIEGRIEAAERSPATVRFGLSAVGGGRFGRLTFRVAAFTCGSSAPWQYAPLPARLWDRRS